MAFYSRKLRFVSINSRYHSGYVVLLPEIGLHLPQQNPLMKDNLPVFSDLTPDKCINTLGKSLLDFEHEVFNIEGQLNALDKPETCGNFFKNVVSPLQRPATLLETTWGIVKTVFLTNVEHFSYGSYYKLHNRSHKAQFSKYYNQSIYKASKKCHLAELSEEERRVVERYQVEGNLSGLGLSSDNKEAFDNFSKQLFIEKRDFDKKIELSKGLVDVKLLDPYVVRSFPSRLLEEMAEDSNEPTIGPWTPPVDDYYFNKFLEYCPDDKLRHKLWESKIQIASMASDVSELQNSVSLEKIRDIRAQQAVLLGYDNYASMSMETKMAGTLSNAMNVLETLREFAYQSHKEEIVTLQEFASSSGFKGSLNVPDVLYWSRKQKKILFNFENEEIRDFFPFEKVFAGLVAFCENMFNIRLELDETVDTWHPEVKFYYIFEKNLDHPVAAFYFDPFCRSGKYKCPSEDGWIVSMNPACQTNNQTSIPLCSLILNLPRGIYGKPSLLSYSEVQGIFRLFGKLLQQLLCSASFIEVSGSSYLEWDAVDIVPNFLLYCLEEPNLLESVSGHYSNGEKLPITNMKEVSAHMTGTMLCFQLYKSVLDLRLYSDTKFWRDIVKEIWPQFLVFPLDENYHEPMNMADIVTGPRAAGYYSYVWSKMIAADLYGSFIDDNVDAITIGKRFRDTYLALGGSCDPHKVFRKFKGRDPTPETFIRFLKLKKE